MTIDTPDKPILCLDSKAFWAGCYGIWRQEFIADRLTRNETRNRTTVRITHEKYQSTQVAEVYAKREKVRTAGNTPDSGSLYI